MSGANLSTFTDFIATTGPSILTDAESIVNEAGKNVFTMNRLQSGKDIEEMIQGGESIKDTIFFDADAGFERYKPNPEFTYKLRNVLTNWSIPWRFAKGDFSYTKHTLGLNIGELSKKARHHKFKTLRRTLWQNLWTGMHNGIEEEFWAQPSNAEMEAADGNDPYSFAVSINEFANGVPPGFTTVQGINPTTQARWRNRLETYAEHPANQTGWDAWQAMTRAWHKCRFDRLPSYSTYSDPTSAPNVMFCSLEGLSMYEQALQRNQDHFIDRTDPTYPYTRFRGTDLVWISQLDTAEVFRDAAGTGFAAEFDATVAEDGSALGNPEFEGPRYWMANLQYYVWVVHQDNFFDVIGPFSPSKQPMTKVVVVDCWNNLACRSRIRQAMISPSADIVAA